MFAQVLVNKVGNRLVFGSDIIKYNGKIVSEE